MLLTECEYSDADVNKYKVFAKEAKDLKYLFKLKLILHLNNKKFS